MFMKSTDQHWEMFGQIDPYFGVLTQPKYKTTNLTQGTREEFFRSGEEYISQLFETIGRRISQDFAAKRVLDFGCGVGRLTIPLSERAAEVVGIDVSDSMLMEASQNCRQHSIDNVRFVKSDSELSQLVGKFDLIHSFIVFQHIPPKRGLHLVQRLLDHLEEGGIGVLHFTYGTDSKFRRFAASLRARMPLIGNLINLFRGREFSYPQIEMNNYSLNELMKLLQERGITEAQVAFTNHGGFYGTVLYFRNSKNQADRAVVNRCAA